MDAIVLDTDVSGSTRSAGVRHASLANTWGYSASSIRAYPQTYPRGQLAGKEVRSTINRLRSAVELLEWRNRTRIRVWDSK